MIFAILAVVLAVVGIVQVLQGQILLGIVLIVLACAIGPGGWTVLNR